VIHYVKGDATDLVGGRGIIAHVCNNAGGWGAGFVLAISARWKEPERRYRDWFRHKLETNTGVFRLGMVQFVSWEPGDVWVANMIAQDGYASKDRVALDYGALKVCLEEVAYEAKSAKMRVQMPRVGCGLAGGTWDRVGPIVEEAMADVDCYVYDLP
jgi:O-acetyl-ADP-ribose deacetylase (regulator of RNase III)